MVPILFFTERGVSVHDVDTSGYTALHTAAKRNSEPDVDNVIRALVSRKADLNGFTKACRGSKRSHEDAVAQTPLMIAAANDNVIAIKTLVSLGAHLDLSAEDGNTALHFAAANGSADAVSVLLSCGASAKELNLSRKTALQVATAMKQSSVVKLLKERA